MAQESRPFGNDARLSTTCENGIGVILIQSVLFNVFGKRSAFLRVGTACKIRK